MIFHSFWAGRWPQQSQHCFPTMASAPRIRSLTATQELTLILEKKLVLKQAKLLEFTAAIRPA